MFPLKYFRIKFYSGNNEVAFVNKNNINEINFFDIEINFKFILEILNEYNYDLQKEFFLQGHYKIHIGFTIGGYFEVLSIEKIKKGLLKLPEQSNITLRLKTICDMNEVDMEVNDFTSNLRLYDLVFNQNSIIEKESNIETENDFYENKSLILSKQNYEDLFDYESSLEEEKKNFLNNNTVSIYYHKNREIKNYIKVNTNIKKKKSIYLEVKDKEIYNNLRDSNLILTQSQVNAPVFDAGYLYGKSFKKIFVGFQMKSLKDSKNKKFETINKNYIIENSIQLLFTSKLLFDVDIVEFHYIVVGILFDSNDEVFNEEKNYSNNLKEHCKNNNIRFIYYSPFIQAFLDSDKKTIKDLLTHESNLFNNEYKPYFEFTRIFIPKITTQNKLDFYTEFIKDMYIQKKNIDSTNCIQEIKKFKALICKNLNVIMKIILLYQILEKNLYYFLKKIM